MSSEVNKDNDWCQLVERLRQDQKIASFKYEHIRSSFLELNVACDCVFQSLWVTNTLGLYLNRVLTHRLTASEWIQVQQLAADVQFVDANQLFASEMVECYSRFLGNLLNTPTVVAEVLQWAGSEGLEISQLTSDLLSVVYGHCLFQHEHQMFVEVLNSLLDNHIASCTIPKELFGVDPIFSQVMPEYCRHLLDLKKFIKQVLHDPIMAVLAYDKGYLEFDVSKAAQRLKQKGREFNVVEYINISCSHLAGFCMQIIQQLHMHMDRFPLTLRWILASLKRKMLQKWTDLSPEEIRRPISYVLFGFILSMAFINPDLLGILDRRVVIAQVGWYNLSQVISVLQGCAWIMDRLDNTAYPMRKVVKLMDMSHFVSLVDSIDANLASSPPLVCSSLPGLKRSSYLLSKPQLDHLVLIINETCNSFMARASFGPVHLEVSKVISVVPHAAITQMGSTSYGYTPSTMPHSSSQSLLDVEPPAKNGGSPSKKKNRSKSVFNSPVGVSTEKVVPREKSRTVPHPVSAGPLIKAVSNPAISEIQNADFSSFPSEVIVFPLWKGATPHNSTFGEDSLVWDLQLLSEEEFLHLNAMKNPPIPLATPPSRPPIKRTHPSQSSLPGEPDKTSATGAQKISASSSGLSATPPIPISSSSSASAVSKPRTMEASSVPLMTMMPTVDEASSGSSVATVTNGSITVLDQPQWSKNKSDTCGPLDQGCTTPAPTAPSGQATVEEQSSKQSWSPGTYNGSVSTDDDLAADTGTKSSSNDDVFGHCAADDHENEALRNCEEEKLMVDFDAVAESAAATTSSAPTTPSKKRSGFRAWFGRKIKSKRKSKSPQQDSFDRSSPKQSIQSASSAPAISASSPMLKRRSKSEYLSGKLAAAHEGEFEMTDAAAGTDADERPPSAPLSRKVSYTRKIGHITAKYEKLAQEAREEEKRRWRKTVAVSIASPTRLDLSLGTLEMFRSCLLYHQLKYKVAFALQSVHSPVLRLGTSREMSMKEQLVYILQGAESRNLWLHDESQTVFLRETLRQLIPLKEEHIVALLSGVWEDHRVKEVYLQYLTDVQKRCHDARIQVSALQEDIERSQQIEENCFIGFSVQQFLEGKKAKMEQFVSELENCETGDERCAIVEDYLGAFQVTLTKDPLWMQWPTEKWHLVTSCMEDHLFAHVYGYVFHPNGDFDTERDQLLSSLLQRVALQVTPQHREIKIPPVYHNSCPWPDVQKHLLNMAAYKSPEGKLQCIVQACKLLIRLLQLAKCGEPPGADDTFPALVYVLIKANPLSLLSTENYINNFCRVTGEDDYWWTQYCSALGFLRTPDFIQSF